MLLVKKEAIECQLPSWRTSDQGEAAAFLSVQQGHRVLLFTVEARSKLCQVAQPIQATRRHLLPDHAWEGDAGSPRESQIRARILGTDKKQL